MLPLSMMFTDANDGVKNKLADVVAWLYCYRLVPYATFSDYMDELLLPNDRDDRLKEELYQIYLYKISLTGRKLAARMRKSQKRVSDSFAA